MKRLAAGIAISLVVATLAPSQPLAQSLPPTFEVATVKANKDGSGLISLGFEAGGRFRAINVPLQLLIRVAYQVQDFQMVGGPNWMSSDRFDIVAKAEGVPPLPEIRLMLRTLLEDRFKLAVHNETRELPIYALVIARSDGKPKPEFRPSGTECAALTLWPGAPPPPPPPAGAAPGRGAFSCPSMFIPGRTSARAVTMAQWATTLSQFVSRAVVDRTGLAGGFDFDLEWTPDQVPPGPPGGAPPGTPGGPPPVDLNGPSLFTALQEQLGLKLDPQRGPSEVLVIDRAEHPTEN